MPLPRGYQGKISPDGARIAYRMNTSWDEERRNYRGGQNRPIWIVDLKTYDLVSPPWTDSKDIDPVWLGDTVYFISDRDGVANVWSFDTNSEEADAVDEVHRLRRQVARRRRRRGRVRAGRLHPRARSEDRPEPRSSTITARRRFPVDDAALGGRHEPHDRTSACRRPASASWSRRAARSSRSRPRRATSATSRTRAGRPSAQPAWSPDGKCISYFSDKSGEYKLVIEAQDGIGAAARDRAREADALLHAVVVARLEEAALHRHQPQRVGDGRRERAGEDRRQRSVDGAAAHAESVVESRLEVGRVREPPQHALSRDLRRATSRPARRSRSPTASPTRCVPAWDASGKYLWFLASTDFGLRRSGST